MARVRKRIVGQDEAPSRKRLRKRELEPFALELYAVIEEALSRYGLSPRAQRRLFARGLRSKQDRALSAAHLERVRSLSDLLAYWRRDALFLDDEGRPKALPVHGRGAAFESLARRFFPQESVKAVVDLAQEYAEVRLLSQKRIALYGDILVRLNDEQAVLAQAVLHVRQVMDTCLYNLTRCPGTLAITERIVGATLSQREFGAFQRLIRPQLHDISEEADRLLKIQVRHRGRPATRAPAGIGIYAFFGQTQRKRRSR